MLNQFRIRFIFVIVFLFLTSPLLSFSRALKELPLKIRRIRYRLIMMQSLKTLNKNKIINDKKSHENLFSLYRILLKQAYLEMEYSYLMKALKIRKISFVLLVEKGETKDFLKDLSATANNLKQFQKKYKILLKRDSQKLKTELQNLEINKEQLKQILEIKLNIKKMHKTK